MHLFLAKVELFAEIYVFHPFWRRLVQSFAILCENSYFGSQISACISLITFTMQIRLAFWQIKKDLWRNS